MKITMQQLLKAAKVRSRKPALFNNNARNKSTAFNPAPSYWAMIPVRIEAIFHSKRKREED